MRNAILALVLALAGQAACAQFGVPWTRSPAVTVVANGNDPRVSLVHEAVAFWNRTLETATPRDVPAGLEATLKPPSENRPHQHQC